MKRLLVLLLILLSAAAYAGTQATAVLFDISKSVPPEDFVQAKVLIGELVRQAGPGDQVLLFAFGNELRRVAPAEVGQLERTASYTNLFDATYDVAQELDRMDAERKSIVVISDGLDTKSATVLEDTVQYVNSRGIAIYGVGVGNTQRKTLERIARLTGGRFLNIQAGDVVKELRAAQQAQNPVPRPLPAKPAPAAKPTPAVEGPGVPPAQPTPTARPAPVTQPKTGRSPLVLPGVIGGGLLLLLAAIFVLVKVFRKEDRACPSCGRHLESYQTICPYCSAGQATPGQSPDSTQELGGGAGTDEDLIPVELLEKKPVTEEMLSKTFVLMETPMLVIRKGREIGRSFSLNRVYPVSIGRSRVNEIKLDDVTISGQHCRIVPENGKHVLYDLGSTNGTFVNEKRVNKTVLKEGDIIKVGETQFLFKVEQQRN